VSSTHLSAADCTRLGDEATAKAVDATDDEAIEDWHSIARGWYRHARREQRAEQALDVCGLEAAE